MCYDCCKEFKGWCKSFTRIEAWLSALQAVLLVVLIAFLTFLILHLLACARGSDKIDQKPSEQNTTNATASSVAPTDVPAHIPSTRAPSTIRQQPAPGSRATLSPEIECTWTPSKKTEATTHYYWNENVTDKILMSSPPTSPQVIILKEEGGAEELKRLKSERNLDELDALQDYKNYVAALVKLKPPEKVTFGCMLTKVTLQWALTAASCIEAIEEVDSLDSFFIMDSYGEAQEGKNHALADVQIHPLYQGANRSYDLAALRSEDVLISSPHLLVQLPTMLEYFLVALGERFTILGYGGYRTIDKSPTGRRLRRAWTYTVSLAQCGRAADDAWAPRHLLRGGPLRAGACGAGGDCGGRALCAGAVRARAAPCAYCGGTPLLRAGRLFGVMSDNRHCGVSCEPALYVNVAALRDWLDSVLIKYQLQTVTVCANTALLLVSLLMAAFVVCTIGAAIIQMVAIVEEGGRSSTAAASTAATSTTTSLRLDDFP